MGNQQERPQGILSRDFVGGLITGEGWFGLTMQRTPRLKVKHGFTIRPRFALQMNDRATMSALMSTLDEWGVGYYVVDKRTKAKSWNNSVRVEIQGMKRVAKLCEAVGDHLYGEKKHAAALVMKFIELRLSKPQATAYGEDEFNIVNELRFVNGANLGQKPLVESSETVRRTLTNLGAMRQSELVGDNES